MVASAFWWDVVSNDPLVDGPLQNPGVLSHLNTTESDSSVVKECQSQGQWKQWKCRNVDSAARCARCPDSDAC